MKKTKRIIAICVSLLLVIGVIVSSAMMFGANAAPVTSFTKDNSKNGRYYYSKDITGPNDKGEYTVNIAFNEFADVAVEGTYAEDRVPIDVVFVLDCSLTMQFQMTAMKDAAKSFYSKLKTVYTNSTGGMTEAGKISRVGIVEFGAPNDDDAKSATVVQSLQKLSYESTFMNNIESLDCHLVASSHIENALRKAYNMLSGSTNEKLVILISDGKPAKALQATYNGDLAIEAGLVASNIKSLARPSYNIGSSIYAVYTGDAGDTDGNGYQLMKHTLATRNMGEYYFYCWDKKNSNNNITKFANLADSLSNKKSEITATTTKLSSIRSDFCIAEQLAPEFEMVPNSCIVKGANYIGQDASGNQLFESFENSQIYLNKSVQGASGNCTWGFNTNAFSLTFQPVTEGDDHDWLNADYNAIHTVYKDADGNQYGEEYSGRRLLIQYKFRPKDAYIGSELAYPFAENTEKAYYTGLWTKDLDENTSWGGCETDKMSISVPYQNIFVNGTDIDVYAQKSYNVSDLAKYLTIDYKNKNDTQYGGYAVYYYTGRNSNKIYYIVQRTYDGAWNVVDSEFDDNDVVRLVAAYNSEYGYNPFGDIKSTQIALPQASETKYTFTGMNGSSAKLDVSTDSIVSQSGTPVGIPQNKTAISGSYNLIGHYPIIKLKHTIKERGYTFSSTTSAAEYKDSIAWPAADYCGSAPTINLSIGSVGAGWNTTFYETGVNVQVKAGTTDITDKCTVFTLPCDICNTLGTGGKDGYNTMCHTYKDIAVNFYDYDIKDGEQTNIISKQTKKLYDSQQYTPSEVTPTYDIKGRDATFVGWIDSAGNACDDISTTPIRDSKTFYAKYNYKINVKFIDPDGVVTAQDGNYTVYCDARDVSKVPSITVPMATKERFARTGYSLVGWKNGGNTYALDYIATVTDDIVFEAVWENTEHTVTYDAKTNGGKKDNQTEKVAYLGDVNLDKKATKDGWTFVGWNTDANAKTALSDYTMPNDDVTLYAIYKKNITATFYDYTDVSSDKIEAPVKRVVGPVTIYNKEEGTTVTPPAIREFTPDCIGIASESKSVGWSLGKNDNLYKTETSFYLTDDATYYAVYDITIGLTYNANGGTPTPSKDAKTVKLITSNSAFTMENAEFTLAAAPSKTGYTFNKWSVESTTDDAVAKKPNETVVLSSDGTAVADWKINSYTVTWNIGSNKTVDSYDYQDTIVVPTNTSKTGYTFTGWDKTVPEKMPAQNLEFTAQYTPILCSAEFYMNDGTEDMYTGIAGIPYGADVIAPTGTPERTGYTFVGWSDNKNASVPLSSLGKMGTNTLKFYAVWANGNSSYSYSVYTMNLSGTYDKTSDVTVPATTDATVTPAITVPTGFTLDIKREDYKSSGVVAADGSLHFDFYLNRNKYTLTFKPNGGILDDKAGEDITARVYYEQQINELIPEAQREGYTFNGWDKEVPDTMPAQDLTFIAQWKVNSYKVYWVVDGKEKAAVKYNYGDTIVALDEPTEEGATFSGWSTFPAKMPAHDVTVNGSFSTNAYKVTYYPENGEATFDKNYEFGALIINPTGIKKTGSTFVRWDYKDEAGTEFTGSTMPSKNLKAYAVWSVNDYTITYVLNNGSANIVDTYKYGDEIDPAKNPTRTGYDFVGWEPAIPETMPAQNIEINADWQIKAYTITFDTKGGSTIAPIKQNYGTKVVKPADPTKTGYTFNGWDKTIPGTMPAENMTITADWVINQYTITFVGNGGLFEDKEQYQVTQNYGTDVADAVIPTRQGYTFNGWDKEIPETMPAENMTITALWKIKTPTITFDANGGIFAGNDEKVSSTQNYGTKVVVPAAPTREGHTFAGWDVTPPETMPENNLTIYAQWDKEAYTINFDSKGGSPVDPIKASYGASINAPENPTKNGYTFAGWYKDEDFEVKYVVPSTMPDLGENGAEMTVYADWTPNQYTYEFKSNGGSDVASITARYKDSITTPQDPIKYGYMFDGWCEDVELTKDYEIPETMPILGENGAVKVLYAKWVPTIHTITFNTDGGSEVSPITQAYGTKVIAPENPTKELHDFLYWYLDDPTVPYAVPETMPNEDITLTALWKYPYHTVTYNASKNGGKTSGDTSKLYRPSENVDLTRGAEKDNGWTFIGWNTDASAETALDAIKMGEKDITLYAIYSKVINVTFKDIADTTDLETPTIEKVETAKSKTIYNNTTSAKFVAPAAKMYETSNAIEPEFIGWVPEGTSLDGNYESKIVNDFTLTNDAKYVAVYKEVMTVKFNSKGGNYTPETQYCTFIVGADGTIVSDDCTLPTAPTREGYKFVKWNGDYELNGNKFKVYKDQTLVAEWEISQYTITFDSNGGTPVDPITDDYGAEIVKPADPTREGHKFGGWSEDVPETMPAENKTLVADWDKEAYTIKFETNGGTNVEDINAEYGDEIAKPANPTKTGNTFDGWYEDAELKNKYTIPATMPDLGEDGTVKTVYAKWKLNEYTITFDTDGGTPISPITETFGADVVKPENPEKTGYTFKKWNKEIPETMPAEDMTIKALYDINQYTITFDTDGGTPIDPITQDYNTDVAKPENPEKEGYTFREWDKEIPETMPAENITITALYDINQYTITFDTDGGTPIDPITQDYNTDVAKPENPEKTGYTFREWDKEIPETMPAENMTIKALYDINQYTITFDTDGGTPIDPITQDYNTDVIKPQNPEKEGYTFREWDREIPETMPDEDITIRALYDINQYTIFFDSNGGTPVDDITADYNSSVEQPDAPTKNGYAFGGWYIENTATEWPFTVPAHDTTMVAHWSSIGYNIAFDKNNDLATGTMDTVNAVYDADVTLPENGYRVETNEAKYMFSGWNTSADGTGEHFENRAVVRNLTARANDTVVLYAMWTKVEKDSFVQNVKPGEVIRYSITVEAPEKTSVISIIDQIPENTSYNNDADNDGIYEDGTIKWTFEGDFEPGYEKVVSFSVTINECPNNTEITNQASVNVDNVIYNTNTISDTVTYYVVKYHIGDAQGTTPVDTKKYSDGETITIANDEEFTNGNYDFAGWNTKEDGTGTHYDADATTGAKNLDLYAQWILATKQLELVDNSTKPGSTVKYTIKVTVPETTSSVVVTDVIPDGLTVDSSSLNDDIVYDGRSIVWNFDEAIEAGSTIIMAFDAQVAETYADGSEVKTGDKIMNAVTAVINDKYDAESTAAVFDVGYFKINYVLGENENGDIPADNNKYSAGSDATIKQHGNLKKDGSEFVGWIDTEGRIYKESEAITVNGNITLRALWGSVTKTSEIAGQTLIPGSEIDYNISVVIPDGIDVVTVTDTVPAALKITGATEAAGIAKEVDGNKVVWTITGKNGKVNLSITAKVDKDVAYGQEISNTCEADYGNGYKVTSNTDSRKVAYIVTYVDGDERYTDNKFYNNGDKAVVIAPNGESTTFFAGWNTKADGSGDKFDIDDTIEMNDNVVLYAMRVKNEKVIIDTATFLPGSLVKYQITFSVPYADMLVQLTDAIPDGLNNIKVEECSDGVVTDVVNNVLSAFVEKPEANKEYKVVFSATISENTGSDVLFTNISCIKVGDKSFNSLPAEFRTDKYFRVFYNANGATGTIPEDRMFYALGDKAKVLSADSLSMKDHYFVGWNTKADGTGEYYDDGDKIKSESDVTLYAIFIANGETPNIPHTGSTIAPAIAAFSAISMACAAAYVTMRRKKNS